MHSLASKIYKNKTKVFSVKLHLGEPSLKKTGKIWEKFPKGGGGEKTDENSQFQFGNFENPGGGLDFSKMSEL